MSKPNEVLDPHVIKYLVDYYNRNPDETFYTFTDKEKMSTYKDLFLDYYSEPVEDIKLNKWPSWNPYRSYKILSNKYYKQPANVPTLDEYLDKNPTYIEPIAPENENWISRQARLWGSSLPALLIKYGATGLLAGGAAVGGLYLGGKAYDWWKNKSIVEAGVNKESEDYSNENNDIGLMNPSEAELSEKIKKYMY